MSKKQEALDKAKQQWKKVKEHGENFWKEGKKAIKKTVGALGHTLGAWYEAWTSKVFESREKEEWIPEWKKKEYWKAKKIHSYRAKDHIEKAKQDGKEAKSWLWRATKLWGKAIAHGAAAWYHVVDAWDKAIWEQIEKKQQKKWKKSWRIWRFARNNITKLMIALGATWYWWYEWWKYIVENNQHKQEVLANAENDIIINPEDNQITILEWDNNQTTEKMQEESTKKSWVQLDETYKDQWVTLLRDSKLTFYVVKKWESLSVIKNKLQKIPEFSYLSQEEYNIPDKWRNIYSFNTPSSSLTPWFRLPIPLKKEDREISEANFKKAAKDALNEMQTNKVYWEKTKELLKNVSEKNIIDIMTAYARCETAPDYKTFSDNIWNVELHRREPSCWAYSFSYFHILMWEWPWLDARKKLWLTEWDCYDAKNACKLFLWYCFEKKKGDPAYFFKVKNLWDAKKVWWTYNWSPNNYWPKFWANIQHVKWNNSYT